MPTWLIFIILVAIVTVIIMVVGFIGNKIVDKGTNAMHKREVEKYNEVHKNDTENLADRFK